MRAVESEQIEHGRIDRFELAGVIECSDAVTQMRDDATRTAAELFRYAAANRNTLDIYAPAGQTKAPVVPFGEP